MTLATPWALAALLLVPLLLGLAWLLRRRRRRAAVRVPSITIVRAALPRRSRWRRRIPAALLVLGLLVLGVGAARPQAAVAVPSNSSTILLALDTSGSMCSTDVAPNRLTAAERAAAEFVRSQAGGPRIGLVAFAGNAALVVPPTSDTDRLLEALPALTTSRGTAIGQGIVESLDAVAEVDPAVPPTGAETERSTARGSAASAIVVLTDGANTQGVEPADAARLAADRGVRVFTIGFGTSTPTPMVCSRNQVGSFGGYGGGGGFRGSVNPLVIDEGALQGIARTTGGTYYRAQNADQLKAALGRLPGTFTLVPQQVDLAAWFAGVGGLLVAAAVALSLWFNRSRGVRPRSPTATR